MAFHDVLIVLGYSTNPDDPVFKARVDTAAKLYHEGIAPQIILSGCCSMKLSRRPPVTEAACMRDYAMDLGVPAQALLLEEASVDTIGNFYFTKRQFLEPCGWAHVGIVTTPWHAFRSQWLAEHILGPDYTITMQETPHPAGWSEADIKRSELKNRTLLAETQEQLAGMVPGDHERVVPFLGLMPPT